MSSESFIAPKHNPLFLWFLDASINILLKMIHNITEVVLSPKDKELLKSLKDQRLIYFSNHPSTKEPPIAFVVSKYTYSRFYYMASREVFDWGYGFVGHIIQAVGAYSIIAGISDRESLRMTRSILASPAGKLVLFPEGEPTGAENDNLLPFQSGIIQLALWGFEDALKQDPNAEIYILPAFVKYRVDSEISEVRADVDKSLENLENKLHLNKKGKTIEERLIEIATAVVTKNEKELGFVSEPNQNFDYRIEKLRHAILDYVADTLSLKKYNREGNAIEKLRQILSILELVQVGLHNPKEHLPSKRQAEWGRKLCQKAYDLISFHSRYILEFPTPERIYEWIYRLENEVLGSTQPRPHKAFVTLAEPVAVSKLYSEYESSKNKKKFLEASTQNLKNVLQGLLNAELKKSYRLFVEDHKF